MKKVLAVVFFLAIAGMFSQLQAQQVLSGYWNADKSTSGYSLNANDGNRSITIEVKFNQPFSEIPKVALTVSTLDADKETNTRFKVEPIAVSRDGFLIKISTWSNSKIYGIGGYWIAHE